MRAHIPFALEPEEERIGRNPAKCWAGLGPECQCVFEGGFSHQILKKTTLGLKVGVYVTFVSLWKHAYMYFIVLNFCQETTEYHEYMRQCNPMNFVRDINVPMLVVSSDDDIVCGHASYCFFTAF